MIWEIWYVRHLTCFNLIFVEARFHTGEKIYDREKIYLRIRNPFFFSSTVYVNIKLFTCTEFLARQTRQCSLFHVPSRQDKCEKYKGQPSLYSLHFVFFAAPSRGPPAGGCAPFAISLRKIAVKSTRQSPLFSRPGNLLYKEKNRVYSLERGEL